MHEDETDMEQQVRSVLILARDEAEAATIAGANAKVSDASGGRSPLDAPAKTGDTHTHSL